MRLLTSWDTPGWPACVADSQPQRAPLPTQYPPSNTTPHSPPPPPSPPLSCPHAPTHLDVELVAHGEARVVVVRPGRRAAVMDWPRRQRLHSAGRRARDDRVDEGGVVRDERAVDQTRHLGLVGMGALFLGPLLLLLRLALVLGRRLARRVIREGLPGRRDARRDRGAPLGVLDLLRRRRERRAPLGTQLLRLGAQLSPLRQPGPDVAPRAPRAIVRLRGAILRLAPKRCCGLH